MRTELFAIFTNDGDCAWAIDALLAQGAQSRDISSLCKRTGTSGNQDPAHGHWNPLEPTADSILRDDEERPGFGGVPSGDLASVVMPGVGTIGGAGPFAAAMISAVSGADVEALDGSIRHHLHKCHLTEELATTINDAYERGDTILSICVPSGPVDNSSAETILNERGTVIEQILESGAPTYGREGL